MKTSFSQTAIGLANGMTTPFDQYEDPTIRAFVDPTKVDRFVQLLGKPRRRTDALKTFDHAIAFDPRWARTVDSKTDIAGTLQAMGSGSEAYLIGTSKDQCILPLDEAIRCVEYEAGIVVCIPGQLAYYCGEDGERRIVLERKLPK